MAMDNGGDASHLQVATELRQLDIVKQDWASVLNSAPASIGILGECMITASLQKASLVHIDNAEFGDLASSLPPNIMKCAQIGTETFVQAHTRMNEIAMNAENVGRRGGTIDKIIQRVEGKDSPAARRMLTRQITMLDSAATVCTEEANKINEYFNEWQKFTNTLLYAMTIRKGQAFDARQQKESEIQQRNALKEVQEKERLRAEWLLNERKENLGKAEAKNDSIQERYFSQDKPLRWKWWGIIFGAEPYSQALSTTLDAKNDLELARAYHDSQLKALEDAEIATVKLEAGLKKLQSENATLEEVTAILYQGIQRLQALQIEITNLLVFFKTIGQRVKFLVQKLRTEFLENVTDEDSLANHTWEDILKEEIREIALPIKAQFLLIHQISLVYSEVSFKFILSGLGMVNMLGLSHDSESSREVELKQLQLREYKRTASEGVKALTEKKRIVINEGIRELIHDSPRRAIEA